ncbi:hypothetical protein LTS18_004046 [Coniosporium uncinatum]|uniref:Uncharacterized protein n=1 Tax=Coniosporium uncinatum TaxID=93489 RepID=A0ACC3DBU0_9PEZI|nr:hypothetical protein LTS18_004046 [Coniosporium uncinatum]
MQSRAGSSRDTPAYTETFNDQPDPQIARNTGEEDSDEEINDDDFWELYDAAQDVDPPAYAEITRQQSAQPVDELAQAILSSARPAKAYASKADGYLNVTMLGATATGFVSELTAQIVSSILQVAVGTAKVLQTRHRRNTFLDQMNDQLFAPRGFYALYIDPAARRERKREVKRERRLVKRERKDERRVARVRALREYGDGKVVGRGDWKMDRRERRWRGEKSGLVGRVLAG